MKAKTLTRRRFLAQAGAAVAAPCVIASTGLGEGRPLASGRIVMGAIGLGGRCIG